MENKKSMTSKKQLNEINFLRPIVIILLVFMHAFTMFTGGAWPLPDGINNVPLYSLLTKVSFSCLLETFVFISGYIFAYQRFAPPILNNSSFFVLVKSKLKRLIIPCIVFSLFYGVLFDGLSFSLQGIYALLDGLGHMWFLPMLFWCFQLAHAVLKIKLPEWVKLLALFASSILTILPLPLRISSAFYYLPFFYSGMVIYKNKESVVKVMYKWWRLLLIVYILMLFCYIWFQPVLLLGRELGGFIKLISIFTLNYGKVAYAVIGMMLMYLLSIKMADKFTMKSWLLKFNALCFGVYLFQQFVLKILYYHTHLPEIAGTYLLPWVGFIFALFISTALSFLLKCTKIGRKLI